MNSKQAIDIAQGQLLPIFVKRYGLEDCRIRPVPGHVGGRNLIYVCEKPGTPARILRISYLEDRTREDFLAELEYVRFLRENGAGVAGVLDSADGNLLEEVSCQGHVFFAALFERAKGKMLAENNIDFDTGQITVYDFDNACFGWYLYDLAELWVHGVGWVQFEPRAEKRREFMDEYFAEVLAGYRSETALADAALENLPLLIQATVMENILDEFEVAERAGEEPDLEDGELRYLVKCLEEGIPYRGFFHEMYSCEEPFTLL